MFLLLCVVSPSVLVFFVPRVRIVAPILLIAGFSSLILCFWAFSFRRNKLGPFVLWTQPAKLLRMAFTAQESLILCTCACVGVGGALAVGVLLATV
jgi:hypothetical protein